MRASIGAVRGPRRAGPAVVVLSPRPAGGRWAVQVRRFSPWIYRGTGRRTTPKAGVPSWSFQRDSPRLAADSILRDPLLLWLWLWPLAIGQASYVRQSSLLHACDAVLVLASGWATWPAS